MTTLVDVAAHIPSHRVDIADIADELGITPLDLGVFRRFFGLREIRTARDDDLTTILLAAARALPGLRGNEHRVRYVLGARTVATVAPLGRNPIHDVADALGLGHAVVLTLTQHACASGLLAIDLAGRLLASDGEPDGLALIITGEKASSPGTRMIEGTTVMGEGTAACLVSAAAPGDRLLAYATRTWGEYHQVPLPPELAAPFGQAYTTELAGVVAEAVAQAGLELDDLRLILPHNVNRVSWKRVCRHLGYPMDRVHLDLVPVTGHCFGADAFINYSHADAAGLLSDGDHYLMAAVGLGATFSAMVFQYREARA
ncbi:3-oxoacyl-[acyl-carrier-protein] synthase III C-terminal domain-containing protein [Oerskovia rustica]|uniref:3-oxoacyl-ACP synthase n=1 Tax=Oerskovia rustica TaxID=2762237 RepID=A0ABR8RWD7_9CELL|nr:3-oxoacyl-[acyl-carrier-protein] synthase III C-terminal domain-containing protein [Oerskovia rustica]MBD7952110.1 3-oxoacyl-ACP synthase [Oerskovia rustica]